jgi:ABC-type branched-subunit amino acid transport system ATPase component
VLRVRALEKSFGPVRVLRGVSLEVGAEECVAIVGETGSGKTTLLRCFNRLVEPDRGPVEDFGEDAPRSCAGAPKGYEIWRATPRSKNNPVKVADVAGTSYVDTDLVAGEDDPS